MKFYAVRRGRQRGIYSTWEACRAQVEGYPGAQYKSFSTLEDAEAYAFSSKTTQQPGGASGARKSSVSATTAQSQSGAAMLQFHLNKFFGLKFRTHGMAIPGEDGLRLVFRHGDAPAKLFDEEIQSVLVDWDNFSGMEVEKGFLSGTKVILKVKSADWLHELPGASEHSDSGVTTTEVELRIHKTNLDDIPAFETKVAEYRSGVIDEDIDEFIDEVRDMLDG